jgi:hypothetical protein
MAKYQRPTVTETESGISGSVIKHPAYGVIRCFETQGGNLSLFGSDLKHNHYVTLEIAQAETKRTLSHEWHMGDSLPIIQVRMTHSQFVSMIQGKGAGAETPVTIAVAPKLTELQEYPLIEPLESNVEKIKNELEEETIKRINDALESVKELEKMIENKTGIKLMREQVKNALQKLESVPNTLKYSIGQAKEEIDKISSQAQIDVECMIDAKLKNIGARLAVSEYDANKLLDE